MRTRKFAVCVAVLLLNAVALSQPATATTTPAAPAVSGESRYIDRPDEIVTRLDSGLTVIVKRYAAAPVVSVRMHVRAGSILEGQYTGAGISHLFEHLLHGGTTQRRTEKQSEEILDRIGASTNAYTSFDRTVYQIDVVAAHAEQAIDLLADWVTRPTFPQVEVDRELGVVQRELERGEQDPQRVFFYKVMEARYQVHPARFPVIGKQDALKKITRDDIIAYYREKYVPSNTIVTVVGDIQPEKTLTFVKTVFADFTARPTRPAFVPTEPEMTSPRTIVHPMDVAQVRFSLAFPTVDVRSDDMYPLDIAMFVLAGGESSRLPVELRDRRRLALAIDASSWTPEWAAGSFSVSGMCMPDKWAELRQAVLAELDRLKTEPITPAQLAQAKLQMRASHIRSQQTTEAMAETLGGSQLALNDAHFDDRYIEKLDRVTVEQVQAAARKYFDHDKLITVLVVPRGFDPNARATTQMESAGIEVSNIRKITLDNGLTVLLRRNTAVPLVAIQMHFSGGLLYEDADKNGVSALMARAALRGTKTRSAQEIYAAFESAGGEIGSNSGRNSFSFSASVLADQLDKTLPVFADVVLNPSFPEDQVELLKKQTLATIARVPEQLESHANRFFMDKMFPGQPYGRPVIGSAETVGRLTREDLAKFHDLWVNGSGVLAIFGDIDLDKTEALVKKLFLIKDKLTVPSAKWVEGEQKSELFINPTKLTRAAEVDMGFAGVTYTDKDHYPLTVLDTMISGYNLPGGWLHETLRGRQLVYVVHAINIGWRSAGLFWIYAQCEPAKTGEVVAAINEQLDRARKGDDFTEEMLANAKATIIAAELMDLQTNDQLASRAALDELLGRGYDSYQKLADRVNAVTLADVKRVAKEYLVNPVTVVTTSEPAAAKKD